jgi:ethanolamine permease
MGTLIALAFLVLFANSAIAPGAAVIGKSAAPLADGFKTLFGEGAVVIVTLAALVGLVASFHTIIFAFGRQIYSLSRAGYFPRVFSLTHPTRRTPHVALVTGSAIGYAVALVIHLLPSDSAVGATLLNMAVFGAVISYGLQMASFVLLRIQRPEIDRPYRSPFGVPGAVAAGVIAVVTFATLFLVETYRPVIVGVAAWYLLGLLYFAVVARHRLVAQAPEEEFALVGQAVSR